MIGVIYLIVNLKINHEKCARINIAISNWHILKVYVKMLE
jgi:hypothetical protein